MFYQFYFLASSLLAHCNLKNLVLQAFEFFFFFFFPLPVNSPFILAYVTMHTIGIFRSLAEGGGGYRQQKKSSLVHSGKEFLSIKKNSLTRINAMRIPAVMHSNGQNSGQSTVFTPDA